MSQTDIYRREGQDPDAACQQHVLHALEAHAGTALIWRLGCRRRGEELSGGVLGAGFRWDLRRGLGSLDGNLRFPSVWAVYLHADAGDAAAAYAAAERFARALEPTGRRNSGAWTEVLPPRDQTPPRELERAVAAGGGLRYTLPDGRTAFYTINRQPVTFGHTHADRHKAWRRRGEGRYILHGLDRLAGRSDAPVVVLADETAVQAVQAVLGEAIATTWHGGLARAGELDLEPLRDREVVLWPGASDGDQAALTRIAGRLRARAQRLTWIGDAAAWDALGALDRLDSRTVAEWIRRAAPLARDDHAVTSASDGAPVAAGDRIHRGRRLSAAEAARAPKTPTEEPLADARQRLHDGLGAFVFKAAHASPLPRSALLVAATTSLGKTSGLFDAISRLRAAGVSLIRRLPVEAPASAGPVAEEEKPHVVAYLAHTRDLAREAADAAAAARLRPFRLRSRLESSDDGAPMCAQWRMTQQLYEGGLGHLAANLCYDHDIETGEETYCEYYADCPYLAQFDDLEAAVHDESLDLVITTHKRLFLGLPKGLRPWLTIVDERCDSEFPDIRTLPAEQLATPISRQAVGQDAGPWDSRDALARRLAGIALQGGDLSAVAARFADPADLEAIDQALKALRAEAQHGLTVTPQSTPGDIAQVCQRAQAGQPLRAEIKLWEVLRETAAECRALADLGRRDAPAPRRDPRLAVRRARDGIHRELVVRSRKTVAAAFRASPVLALDATGDKQLLERGFSSHVWEELTIHAEQPHLELIAVPDVTVANRAVDTRPDRPEPERRAAEALLRDLRAEIEILGQHHAQLVVFTTKAVQAALVGDKWQPPANVTLSGFGEQRGLNRYASADGFYLVGRIQPPLAVLEDHTMAYFGDSAEPPAPFSDGGGTLPVAPGYWWLRSGAAFTKPVPLAPCAMSQLVLDQFREANLLQAIGRARGASRSDTARVYVRTSVPLPVTWDRVITASALRGEPDTLPAAYAALGGLLPLTPPLLRDVSSQAFGLKLSEDAAKTRLKAGGVLGDPDTAAAEGLRAIVARPAIVHADWHGTRGGPRRILVDGDLPTGEAEERCRAFLADCGYEVRRCDLVWRDRAPRTAAPGLSEGALLPAPRAVDTGAPPRGRAAA